MRFKLNITAATAFHTVPYGPRFASVFASGTFACFHVVVNFRKLIRKFIRTTGIDAVSKLMDFLGSFYWWKVQKFPNVLSREEWQRLKREDEEYTNNYA